MRFVTPLLLALLAPTSFGLQTLSNDVELSTTGFVPYLEEAGPWTLQEALGLPDWLEISGEHRTRFETVDEQFRGSDVGHDQLFALRTLLKAKVKTEAFDVVGELIDSRQYGAPDDSPLNTGIVNAVDLLQGYVGTTFDDIFAEGSKTEVLFGRHTFNVGSRRLVARNRYRNTINSFTGFNALWTSDQKDQVRAFYVLPVRRLPRDQASLDDNELEFDEEQDRTHFFGLHAASPNVLEGLDAEAYLLRIDEEDQGGGSTRDRRLWTAGTRLQRKIEPGEFGFEIETMWQTGESRASSSGADVTDLDHLAQFHHISFGYQFESRGEPRLEGLFDYASGDDDPTDDENNRFDTLFGARRFEFGPTGILGIVARANILSPGLRLTFFPDDKTTVMLAHRVHYLASDQDGWTTSSLADPTGDSGRHVGQFSEIRVRHDLERQRVRFEGGLAHFQAGDFVSDAPTATSQGDLTYGYIGAQWKF